MQDPVIQSVLHYKYALLIVLATVEGPLIMMIAGFILKLGYLSFIPTYLSLIAGDLIGDVGWYGVGYFLGESFFRRFGKFFSITPESIATVKRIFHKHKNSILFISKITMGFGFALVTLITAGLVKIPFRRYFVLNFFGQFIWTGLLLYVGFSFGNFYTQVNGWLSKVSVIVLFALVFFGLIGLGKYFKNQFTKTK